MSGSTELHMVVIFSIYGHVLTKNRGLRIYDTYNAPVKTDNNEKDDNSPNSLQSELSQLQPKGSLFSMIQTLLKFTALLHHVCTMYSIYISDIECFFSAIEGMCKLGHIL